jgi:hypothetical protein
VRAKPVPQEAPASAGLVHVLLERLASEYAEDPYRTDVAEAREDYFSRAGKVFEDDAELFDTRIAAFLEWYVIERPLRGGPPPVCRTLAEAGSRSQDESTALAHIATSHRSLFDVAAVAGGVIQLEDLLGGARFSVTERRSTAGFEVGDVLEARLIWNGDEVVFGKTFLFHPRDARQEVLEVIDAGIDKNMPREDIMFRLSRRHLRWHRLKHVGAARIYRDPGP